MTSSRPQFVFSPSLESPADCVGANIEVRNVAAPDRSTAGAAVSFIVSSLQVRLHVSQDMVNANFGIGGAQPHQHFGRTLSQFVADPSADDCLFACNVLHTNFVRGNGFVVSEGRLIHKPPGAAGLDGNVYVPLGQTAEGESCSYDTLALFPSPPELREMTFADDASRNPSTGIELAVSGPAIVRDGVNVATDIPVRLRDDGQTVGNEINFDPVSCRTSFTAFGVSGERCVAVSMFAGRKRSGQDVDIYSASSDQGVTLSDMADLMIGLGATDAIAGGGSGDTQQFVSGRRLAVSSPRPQPGRIQVAGTRGLGVIMAVFPLPAVPVV